MTTRPRHIRIGRGADCASRGKRAGRGRRGDRGSTAVELTLLAPLLLLLWFLAIAAGRGFSAQMRVESAARQGARAATTTRDPADAAATATATATAALGSSAACRTHQIQVDTADFVPGGNVAVTVTCQVDLSGLTGLDLPATKAVSARFVSPLDTFISDVATAAQP
jgi:Flp pilus assembly protein TadG